jgi:RND family efflux transporter MFP subunit
VNPALLRWLPAPVLLVGGLVSWWLAQGKPGAEPSAPPVPLPTVEVVEPVPQNLRLTVRTHGSVEPRTEIDLVAEVAGRVSRVSQALAAGGFFEAGDVLVELDRGDAALALERAEAALLRMRSQLGLAEARLARLEALARSDITSASRLEEAQYAAQSASADLRDARARRDQARRDLERTRIAAPFAGRVRAKRADVGQFVARGTKLARIYAVDWVEVRLPIPSSELVYLDLPIAGRDGAGGPEGADVILRSRFAGRPARWHGRIVRTEGEIAADSRMLHAVARVEDPYGREGGRDGPPLTVGLFVEAEILGRTFENLFVLPRTALRGTSEVLVVDETGRLRARRVEVLRSDDDRVFVASGLRAGERVSASAVGPADGTRVHASTVPGIPAGRGP